MVQATLTAWAVRAEPFVRGFVESLCVVGLALVLARMIWLALSPEPTVAEYRERPLPTMMATRAVASGNVDRSLLIRANPFEGATFTEEVIEDAPETQLNLRLIGLRADRGPDAGSATIVLPNNQQKKFIEGDEILPNVDLKRVLSDRVILTRNGIDEVLRLNNRSGRFSVIGDGAVPAVPQGVESAPTRVQVADPQILLNALSLSEARSNGRTIGYRVEARSSLEDLRALGFEPGDVLVEVNGQRVADLDTAELLDTIGAYQEALVTLDRSGANQQVIFQFNE